MEPALRGLVGASLLSWRRHNRCHTLSAVQRAEDFPIALIGAGFTGIGAVIQLN